MSKIQTIVGLLLFLIILFSMNMIFGNVLRKSFTTNIQISSPSVLKYNNEHKIYSRLLTQNQNDDQPLFFGFS
jgi:hypothetical protein